MAVRLSMGAGRFRVVRQLLTESVLLASIGGALGVAFAIWGIRFLTLLLANGQENFTLHADLNWHVLGAALALSLLTGLLFGLAPALQSTRADIMPALKATRAGQPGAAKAALELIAKLTGILVERKELRVIRSIEDLTDEELSAIVASDRSDGDDTRTDELCPQATASVQ